MGKLQANRQLYIRILRSLTPEQRLRKAFELTAMTRNLARADVARRHPDLGPEEIDRLTRDRIMSWHNRTS
jgi:hypothetical protein